MRRHFSLILLVMTLVGSAADSWGAATVTDDRGQEVVLNSPPRRIISLYGAITEILQALGATPEIVARTRGDETLPDLPTVGTHLQPNLEMILALKPDLVVQGGVKKGLLGVRGLEQEGVPVAVFAPHDFPGLFGTIRRLGELTGKNDQAGALVKDMEARLQEVARQVAGRGQPKVFFEVRYHNLLAAGQGSLVHHIITRAGGQNIVASSQKLVSFSLETLIKEDPEVYIIQKGPMNRSPQDIKARPHYDLLQAVRRGRVLVVEESLFSRPGPRSVEAVETLARLLHPDAGGGVK